MVRQNNQEKDNVLFLEKMNTLSELGIHIRVTSAVLMEGRMIDALFNQKEIKATNLLHVRLIGSMENKKLVLLEGLCRGVGDLPEITDNLVSICIKTSAKCLVNIMEGNGFVDLVGKFSSVKTWLKETCIEEGINPNKISSPDQTPDAAIWILDK